MRNRGRQATLAVLRDLSAKAADCDSIGAACSCGEPGVSESGPRFSERRIDDDCNSPRMLALDAGHRETTVRRKFRWISTAQLAVATHELAGILPASVSGIIGIPRSGMIPASILSTLLQVPLLELGNNGEIRRLGHGSRGEAFGWACSPASHLVVVDDTVYGGRTMDRVRRQTASIRQHLLYAAVFVLPQNADLVDVAARQLESPHLLEWNYFNSGVIVGNAADPALWGGAALDFDGVCFVKILRSLMQTMGRASTHTASGYRPQSPNGCREASSSSALLRLAWRNGDHSRSTGCSIMGSCANPW